MVVIIFVIYNIFLIVSLILKNTVSVLIAIQWGEANFWNPQLSGSSIKQYTKNWYISLSEQAKLKTTLNDSDCEVLYCKGMQP